MVRYIARRLIVILVVAVAIVYFTFLGMHMIDNWEGEDPGFHLVSDGTLAAEDTIQFFRDLLQGTLPEVPTVSGPRPLSEIVPFAYRNSMGLLLMAFAAATVIGVGAGTFAALSRRGSVEYAVLFGTIVGVSAPSFLIAVLLQALGIEWTKTFGFRLVSMGGFAWDRQHLLLPLIVLAARPIAYLTRASYLGLSRIMDEDFIRTAYSKGLPRWRVVLGHAMRNLAVPLFAALGVTLRFALSTLVLVEFIFAWPGIGLTTLEGINDRIPLLVVACALVLGLTIQGVNLSLDLLYYIVDPRIRESS